MMSKKSAIILILVVFLSSLGALIWFYFSGSQVGNKPPIKQAVVEDVYDPFGTKTVTDLEPVVNLETPTDNTDQNNFITPNKLRRISDQPMSGYSIIDSKKDNKTHIRYILRANGNIYETYTDETELKRLSITTVPKVYESNWLAGGDNLIIRFLRDNTENISTFSVKINPATTTLNEFEGGIDGVFLPESIAQLVVNPLGDKIFYLTSNLNGSSGFTANPNGLNKKLLFESPLIEWNISWPKAEIITMNTRPAKGILGYMYFLNSNTGSFSKTIGGIDGLTTKTSPDATKVLYSDSVRNTPRLYLYDIKKDESKLLPWSTFPEKCLWSNTDNNIIYCAVPKNFPAGDYPDSWYQGLANFTDEIWRIDTSTETVTLVFDIQKETSNNIDAVELEINENDNYLFFVNKTDLTLWSLNLK